MRVVNSNNGIVAHVSEELASVLPPVWKTADPAKAVPAKKAPAKAPAKRKTASK